MEKIQQYNFYKKNISLDSQPEEPVQNNILLDETKPNPNNLSSKSEKIDSSKDLSNDDSLNNDEKISQPTIQPLEFIKDLDPNTIGKVNEAITLSVELSRQAENFKWLFNHKEIPMESNDF